jgi:hypothetical protein
MPPEVRGLEIFLADLSELTGSSGVTLMTAAAVTHFFSLEGFDSPFTFPRFGKIMRGIKASYGKAAKPRWPFTTDDIVKFMWKARSGSLKDWRVALLLALCFQQLLRGTECFDLNGSNVSINDGYLGVVVETSKNHPKGFSFRVHVNRERPNCVGVFMLHYIILMEIRVGDPGSFFVCKLTSTGGILRAVPSERVSDSTMRASCKILIAATGLDPSEYATHSSKRGGALMALQAGLSTAQIQELGRWSCSAMVSRYAKGDDDTRENLAEACRV